MAMVTSTDFADIVNNLKFGDVGEVIVSYGKKIIGTGVDVVDGSEIVTMASGICGPVALSLSQGTSSVPLTFTGVSSDGITNPLAFSQEGD